MPIMPHQGPLWNAIVQKAGGIDHVWPADTEEGAEAVAQQWQNVADQVGQNGYQASQAAAGIDQAWKDGAGKAAVEKTNAYHERVKVFALQVSQLNILSRWYAEQIKSAKNAVNAEVQSYEGAYAAASTPAPGSALIADGIAFLAAQGCMKIIDQAAKAIKNVGGAKAAADKRAHDAAVRAAPGNAMTAYNALLAADTKAMKASADAVIAEQAAANAKVLKWFSRGLGFAMLPVSVGLDMQKGESFAQAATSNGVGLAAAIGTGALIGTAIGGPVGTIVGAGAGVIVGAFTSGAVDSLFENSSEGVAHVGTAIADGAGAVGDMFKGIGNLVTGN